MVRGCFLIDGLKGTNTYRTVRDEGRREKSLPLQLQLPKEASHGAHPVTLVLMTG